MSDGRSARSGSALNRPLDLLRIDLDPRRDQIHLLRDGQRFLHAQLALGALAQRDLVARAHLVRGQVDLLAIDANRRVRDELACLRAGHREAHAVDDVVQTRFEHAQQVLAGIALLARGLLVIRVELALEQAIDALDLLLLAQLHAVVRDAAALGAAGAVLAGLLLELALRIERARGALEAEIGAFAARELAGGSDITCHSSLGYPLITRVAFSADGIRCAESASRR